MAATQSTAIRRKPAWNAPTSFAGKLAIRSLAVAMTRKSTERPAIRRLLERTNSTFVARRTHPWTLQIQPLAVGSSNAKIVGHNRHRQESTKLPYAAPAKRNAALDRVLAQAAKPVRRTGRVLAPAIAVSRRLVTQRQPAIRGTRETNNFPSADIVGVLARSGR